MRKELSTTKFMNLFVETAWRRHQGKLIMKYFIPYIGTMTSTVIYLTVYLQKVDEHLHEGEDYSLFW